MGSLLHQLLFLGLSFCCTTVAVLPPPEQIGIVLIDGRVSIANIDEDFICANLDWWPPQKCDYGTCSWGSASLLNLDLNNKILLNAVKALSPLKVRLGGTLQDIVTYKVEGTTPCGKFVKNRSLVFGYTPGCLPMPRWDELNNFFTKAGAKIIFGLNGLRGRMIKINGTSVGPWDSTNAAALMRYTVQKNYTIHGWELGNELSGKGIGTRVTASQYVMDLMKLHSVVNEIYRGFKVIPKIIAPDGLFRPKWFKELLDTTPDSSIDVVTHHLYNLGAGNDKHLKQKILNPNFLDKVINTFGGLDFILKTSPTSAVAWVGEAGGAANSGRHLVTDAFVFSFWYLDQLGMASTFDTKTYCRQTLIGGHYGLLDTTTFLPNPDYYSALLWKKLMGRNVLLTNFIGTKKIRAYSHCAKQSKGIVLLLINLDGKTTVQVSEAIIIASSNTTRVSISPTGRFTVTPSGSTEAINTREEYHLTAPKGDLSSRNMLLNGKILAINSSGDIPALEPTIVKTGFPIGVAPYSIVFVHIPSIAAPACR